jgi:hypothetical protein
MVVFRDPVAETLFVDGVFGVDGDPGIQPVRRTVLAGQDRFVCQLCHDVPSFIRVLSI